MDASRELQWIRHLGWLRAGLNDPSARVQLQFATSIAAAWPRRAATGSRFPNFHRSTLQVLRKRKRLLVRQSTHYRVFTPVPLWPPYASGRAAARDLTSCDERTRVYIAKKRAEGKSTKEAMRCLKPAICREVYRLLTNPPEIPRIDDLRPLRQAHRISLATAAGRFGVWPATISNLERGLRRDDNLATAYRRWLIAA